MEQNINQEPMTDPIERLGIALEYQEQVALGALNLFGAKTALWLYAGRIIESDPDLAEELTKYSQGIPE